MSMTHESVLRELELLPVWKLRAPLPTTLAPHNSDQLPQAEPADNSVIENIVVDNEVTINKAAVLIFSDDKKWLFVLPEVLTGESAELFNNILRALKIKPAQTAHSQQLTQDIDGASVVVTMGEIAAHLLLNTAQTLTDLRGKLHLVNNVPVIVTYHPDELLQHLPHKAKTWEDLCMALNALPV